MERDRLVQEKVKIVGRGQFTYIFHVKDECVVDLHYLTILYQL